MARSTKNADPKPDPNAPAVTDPNDRDDDAAGADDGDDDEDEGGDDDEDEVDGQLADHDAQLSDHDDTLVAHGKRLAHVEDILHRLLTHAGEAYVGAGNDRVKLAGHIEGRAAQP
jgi:hypothetical protein